MKFFVFFLILILAAISHGAETIPACKLSLEKISSLSWEESEGASSSEDNSNKQAVNLLVYESNLLSSKYYEKMILRADDGRGKIHKKTESEKLTLALDAYAKLQEGFSVSFAQSETFDAQKINDASREFLSYGLSWKEAVMLHELFALSEKIPELKRVVLLTIYESLNYDGVVNSNGKKKSVVKSVLSDLSQKNFQQLAKAQLLRLERDGDQVRLVRFVNGQETKNESSTILSLLTYEHPILFSTNYLRAIQDIIGSRGDEYLANIDGYSESAKQKLSADIWDKVKRRFLSYRSGYSSDTEKFNEKELVKDFEDEVSGRSKSNSGYYSSSYEYVETKARQMDMSRSDYIESFRIVAAVSQLPGAEKEVVDFISAHLKESIEFTENYMEAYGKVHSDYRGTMNGFEMLGAIGVPALMAMGVGAGIPLHHLHGGLQVLGTVGGGAAGLIGGYAASAATYSGIKDKIKEKIYAYRERKVLKRISAYKEKIKNQPRMQNEDEE